MAGVVILGGGGVIGRATVAEARRRGVGPVRGIGRGSDAPAAVARQLDSWDELELGTDPPATLRALLRRYRPTTVVNATGRTDGDRATLVRANVLATAAVVDAMAGQDLGARLVHVGSAAEYGAPASDRAATSEEQEARPVTAYGVTKLAATALVLQAVAIGELDAAVARVFNPLGAGLQATSLPGRALERIRDAMARGDDEVRFGPLGAVRDYVDLRDIASALLAIGDAATLPGAVINVGSGTETVVRVIPRLVAERLGFGGAIAEDGEGSPRSGGVDYQRADVSRLRSLGWQPRYDMAASVDALVGGSDAAP